MIGSKIKSFNFNYWFSAIEWFKSYEVCWKSRHNNGEIFPFFSVRIWYCGSPSPVIINPGDDHDVFLINLHVITGWIKPMINDFSEISVSNGGRIINC